MRRDSPSGIMEVVKGKERRESVRVMFPAEAGMVTVRVPVQILFRQSGNK